MTDDTTKILFGLLWFAIMGVIYFFPFIVALIRGSNQKLAIFILNLFVGWTGLGWLGSMVWACISNKKGNEQ